MIFNMAVSNCLNSTVKGLMEVESGKKMELHFLGRMLEFLLSLDYSEVRKEDFEVILDAFWSLFRETNLNIYANRDFLTLSLQTILRMFEADTEDVFRCLKEVGLGARLASILDSPLGHSSPDITGALI